MLESAITAPWNSAANKLPSLMNFWTSSNIYRLLCDTFFHSLDCSATFFRQDSQLARNNNRNCLLRLKKHPGLRAKSAVVSWNMCTWSRFLFDRSNWQIEVKSIISCCRQSFEEKSQLLSLRNPTCTRIRWRHPHWRWNYSSMAH